MANHEHDDDRQGEGPRHARRASSPLGKRGPVGKILVVDDVAENRYMLRALLEGHGHCVVEASNGQEALDLGRTSPPDCVISDLLMPVMDGFTLCREWVRDERVRDIPFVVCTATYTEPRDEQLALELGARRYLRKPAAPEDLVAAIEELMEAAARGELPPPTARTAEAQVGEFVLYNERLVRKLEQRMLKLAKARTELAASERRYKELFDRAPHAYFCVGVDGRIRMVNEVAERLVDRPAGDLVGLPILDLYADAPEGKAKAEQVLARFRAGAPVEGEELAMQRPDGSLAWVRLSVHPTLDEGGRAASSRSIAIDITKDKRAQDITAARLRLLEIAHERSLGELLTAMLDELEALTGSSIGFFHLVDADQTTLTLQAFSTRTRERCPVGGEARKCDVAQAGLWLDCLRERRPVVHNDDPSLAHRKGLPDGHVPVVREAAAPVFRGDQVRAIIGVGNKPADYTAADLDAITTLGDLAFDIADRKRVEDKLRTSEERYRSLFEHSLDGIVLEALDGRILAANPAACRLLDRDEAEMCAVGRAGIVDLRDPRGRALVEQCALNGEATGPLTLLRRDGSGLEVELTTAVFETPEGPRVYKLLRDLTERRRMEGVLTEAARIGNLGYWSYDFANDLITWSDEALKILGLSRDQGPFGIGAHLARVHPDDREMMRRVHETAKAGDSPFTVEYRIVLEGGDVRWLRSQGEVEKDPKGRPIGASGVFRDITRDKAAQAALEQQRDDLERQVRARTADLAAARDRAEAADRTKSAFLATMSHELRTPLNSVIGFTGILLQEIPGPLNAEQHKQLGMVRSSGRHLLALINDVLDISRIEAGQLELHVERFSLSDAVRSVVAPLVAAAEANGVALELAEPLAQVSLWGDRRRLEQVLLNLVGNAVKFTERGRIRVEYHLGQGLVEISVSDTGIGIPPGHLERIFEAFHQIDSGSTRRFEGTGLGLTICRRLVEAMGGRIRVESELGAGSVFRVTLPLRLAEGADR